MAAPIGARLPLASASAPEAPSPRALPQLGMPRHSAPAAAALAAAGLSGCGGTDSDASHHGALSETGWGSRSAFDDAGAARKKARMVRRPGAQGPARPSCNVGTAKTCMRAAQHGARPTAAGRLLGSMCNGECARH